MLLLSFFLHCRKYIDCNGEKINEISIFFEIQNSQKYLNQQFFSVFIKYKSDCKTCYNINKHLSTKKYFFRNIYTKRTRYNTE